MNAGFGEYLLGNSTMLRKKNGKCNLIVDYCAKMSTQGVLIKNVIPFPPFYKRRAF